MNLEHIIDRLKEQDYASFNLDTLYNLLLSYDFDNIDHSFEVPVIDSKTDYGRNILMMDPMEVVILYWPPGVSSAIHHHQGFWGVVAVVSGELENISYRFEYKKLWESLRERGLPGGLIKEEDGVIHELCNPSETEAAVTIHFYCPALESFDKMVLFEKDERKIGLLNADAQTASWHEPNSSFHKVETDAFELLPCNPRSIDNPPSHRIYPIVPKPSADKIATYISDYYDEQSKEYDHFDTSHTSRARYVDKVNELIALDLREMPELESVLSIACGTGRREVAIQRKSERQYALYGTDLSPEMCDLATDRGIEVNQGRWLETDYKDQRFDAITILYAFGHISSRKLREEVLAKVADHLKTGGRLYFDVFNLHDKNEWGPSARSMFEKRDLEKLGYELGDVFYRKSTGKVPAYLHYFEEKDVIDMIESSGLHVVSTQHVGYTVKSGELLDREDEGAIFIIAEKRA